MSRPSIIFGAILILAIIVTLVFWDARVKEPPKTAAGAIAAGCDWLKRHQGVDGTWSGSGYSARCAPDDRCESEPLHAKVDPALTGLALLALDLDARDPVVVRALVPLKEWKASGDHGLFNLLLAAAGVSRYDEARPEWPDATKFEDCHVGWALDLGVNAEMLLAVLDVQRQNGQSASPAVDAMRALTLMKLGRDAKEALDAAAARGPGLDQADLFFWYWALRAFKSAGDPRFDEWAPLIRTKLLVTQKSGLSCSHGSWDPMDPWAPQGGRIYTTAMAVLILRIVQPD